MNAWARNLALLVLLAFVWGASSLLIKLAVATMPPLMVAAVRILSALMLLLGVAWMTRVRIPRELATWRALLPVSLFGYVLPPFLVAFGQQRIDAGAAAIAIGAVPIFTALLSQLVLRTEQLSAMAAFGLLLGFTGIVVLVGPSAFNELDHNLAGFAPHGAAFPYARPTSSERGTRGLNLSAAGWPC
jgi:drug/metabolite transporter (DMT)-like permease